jgi:hypothetical protein
VWGFPRRGERYERNGRQTPGNSDLLGRTFRMRKSLKSGLERAEVLAESSGSRRERQEGKVPSRGVARYRKGKTSESENPRALPV